MHPSEDPLDPTVTDAQALTAPWFLDVDEYDFDFGPDIEDSMELRADAMMEQEVDDLAIEKELAELLGEESLMDEVDDMFDDEAELARGRVAMANRARAALDGPSSSSFNAGVSFGYLQALRDMGVHDSVVNEQYGGLFSFLKKDPERRALRQERRAAGGGLGGLLRAATQGFTGGKTLSELAGEAGSGVRESFVAEERLGPKVATIPSKSEAPSEPAGVEADAESLPPIYVEDEQGFDEEFDEQSDMLEDDDITFGLTCEDRYGQSCKYGMVEEQPRDAARKAARRAVKRSIRRMSKSKRKSPKPFVEDPNARPMLFSDGRIWDSVYGAMNTVPCPSCTRLHPSAVRNGGHKSCVVCEGYGAVIVPESDVDTFLSSPSYGLIPLLLLAGKVAAKAAPAMATPEGQSAVKSLLQRKRAQRIDQQDEDTDLLEESEEDEIEAKSDAEAFGAMARCLVPTGWWRKRQHGGNR
jgi:hypothetical protein